MCDRVGRMRVRTVKRQCIKVLVIVSLALLYNEWLVYYLVLTQCGYPVLPSHDNSNRAVSVMVLADTHLLGSRLGHWADKLRREWQMFRTFQTAQTLFTPQHVFFLGTIRVLTCFDMN